MVTAAAFASSSCFFIKKLQLAPLVLRLRLLPLVLFRPSSPPPAVRAAVRRARGPAPPQRPPFRHALLVRTLELAQLPVVADACARQLGLGALELVLSFAEFGSVGHHCVVVLHRLRLELRQVRQCQSVQSILGASELESQPRDVLLILHLRRCTSLRSFDACSKSLRCSSSFSFATSAW